MNPGTVRGQAVAASILLVLLAAIGRPALAASLAAVGGLWALLLNRAYAKKLGPLARAPRRMKGDRAIAQQLILCHALPFTVGLTLLIVGWSVDPAIDPLKGHEAQGLVGVVTIMVIGWLASSHVDWYYIRPRIDGVVVAPPCQTSRDTMWKGVTRKWYIHRAAASLITMLAVVALALIVTLILDREWPNALAQAGGFAAIIGVGLWLMSDEVKSADSTSRSIRSPRYWVGDDLKYDTDMWCRRGYVLHVAVPVTKLIPLDRETGERLADVDYVEEPAPLLSQVRCVSGRFSGCPNVSGGCGRFNPECTYREPRGEVGRRRRLIL